MAKVVKMQTAEVTTTDATATTIFNGGDKTSAKKGFFALVWAAETTSGADAEYQHWALLGQVHDTFEGSELVTNTEITQGGSGGGGASYNAAWVTDTGDIVLQVTGGASDDITWNAVILEMDLTV